MRQKCLYHFRQLQQLGLLPPDANMKQGFEMTSYMQDEARLRLQQFAANASNVSYFNNLSQPGRQAYKQPFTIENIIAPENKSSSTSGASFPVSPLPAFASQFAVPQNISANFMLPFHGLRPTESELLSSLACTYGQMNGRVSALEYYNSIKSSLHHPTLPLPIKPTALSAIALGNKTESSEKPKPHIVHSVDSLLKPSKEQLSPTCSRRPEVHPIEDVHRFNSDIAENQTISAR